jgi:hypothetical protein
MPKDDAGWLQDIEDAAQYALSVALAYSQEDAAIFLKEVAIECRVKSEEVRNGTHVGEKLREG